MRSTEPFLQRPTSTRVRVTLAINFQGRLPLGLPTPPSPSRPFPLAAFGTSQSCVMAATRRSPPWADLQPELLGLVLRRLPSLADRVRLRAVCCPWRRGARLEPMPPPQPWVTLLDGTFLSIPGGEIHRMPVPEDARVCHGSVGNWLFLEHVGGGCSLMNPFSKDVVQLPTSNTIIWYPDRLDALPRRPIFFKLVLLSSLDPSPNSMFAVLSIDTRDDCIISICRPPTATAFRVPDLDYINDLAFFDGKLYAVSLHNKLFVLEIDRSYEGKPRIPPMKCIIDSIDDSGTIFEGYMCTKLHYLVESSGRLLHIRRQIGFPLDNNSKTNLGHTLAFEVFEADLTADSCGQWRRLSTLGDQALFVGTHSKFLLASESGVREDCIYFIRDYARRNSFVDPFYDCGMFNMKNGMITPLLPETALVRPQDNKGRPAWFFPAEAM
ncbi:F-box/kelch-repeat protein At1g57790-like [Phragmites australis]|uniref:F-box/kelch-repeat protein At1g57790-like n=1 Tax=Phragmites australis TaxID=29695 RepID=UPI002D7652B7|nr:F-box/kelch-repeat protein At1g57790-like [Phragmites australis]